MSCTYVSCAEPIDPGVINLSVDLSEAPRHIIRSRLSIPVRPGPLQLAYPKWIQGHHRPAGPIADLVGLEILAEGKTLPWKRDPIEMYLFRVEVPEGVSRLDISFEHLTRPPSNTTTGSTSAHLAVLNWSEVILYPVGRNSEDIFFSPHLRVKPGWKWATSLSANSAANDTVEFADVSMTRLMDSPVLAGEYFRTIDLSPGATPPHFLDIAADSRAALEIPSEAVDHLRAAVKEAGILFGAHHYRQYHFLFSLSDQVGEDGTEHHESSDDRCPERFFLDSNMWHTRTRLLVHEFMHSWNGKYRRPTGIATPNPLVPIDGSLLWVYEGLTRYLEWVMSSRSGALSAEFSSGYVARLAAQLDHRDGREWRPLEDTAVSVQLLYDEDSEWESLRRGVDYYDEGLLIWLEVDTTIRKLTAGRRSLDDFCRAFLGGHEGGPEVKPYTFEELIASLNEVAPYHWKQFFESRIRGTGSRSARLEGLEAAGWRLSYQETPNAFEAADDSWRHVVDARYSVGMKLQADGQIADILVQSPAYSAGLAPWMKILAINRQPWSPERLHDAIRLSSTQPVELVIDNGGYIFPVRIDYQGSESYPVLTRNQQADLLSAILAPRAPRLIEPIHNPIKENEQ